MKCHEDDEEWDGLLYTIVVVTLYVIHIMINLNCIIKNVYEEEMKLYRHCQVIN